MDELLRLADTFGPLGTVVIVAAWWFATWRSTKRNSHNPSEHDILLSLRDELKGLRGELRVMALRLEDVWKEVHHAS